MGRRLGRVIARCAALAVLVSLTGVAAGCGGDDATATSTSAPAALVSIGAGIEGPAGLTATVYASGLEHVAAFAFDADGRLWAATAAFEDEGDDAVYVATEPGAQPVRVLTDVHTPLGLLWIGDELYVSSRERVDAYAGFDGTAFASSRAVLALPTGVGEVNGLAVSPAGRVYLGISAPCDSCTPESDLSGAVVSFLPDGTDLRVEAGSIRAPIGLVFFPGTDDLFVTMNQRDDLGDATPGDWLAVVAEGEDWGFPECYGQGGDGCAGVPEPVAELDEHAAVSGVAIVTGQLGVTVGTAAIVAEWATGEVLLVALETTDTGEGPAYAGTVRPFLTGVQNPVAVALAPDGSVVVGDWTTGTIYLIST
jgi:glucose/arabinose dehydrogenase